MFNCGDGGFGTNFRGTILMRHGIAATDPLVVAVVLNWNKAEQSAECVRALQRQTYHNLHILIVDNGSVRGTLGPLLEFGDSVKMLCNDQNRGFTGGVNVGICCALEDGAEFVWLVNNDAQPAANTLALMLREMRADPWIGLASPVIRNADDANAIEFYGGIWSSDGATAVTNDPALYNVWQKQSPERIWLVGTALLLRRQVVESIGLFDDRFFAYWEDNDYSLRSSQAGFRNIVVAEAEVRHWSGASEAGLACKPPHYHYYMARNEILFLRKHLPPRAALKSIYWALRRQLRRIHGLRSVPNLCEATAVGLWDGFVGRGGSYDQRSRLGAWPACIMHALKRTVRHRY